MEFSQFGTKFSSKSGILELMKDLDAALNEASETEHFYFFGGGNPAVIPEMQKIFKQEMYALLEDEKSFEIMIGNYDSPSGNKDFKNAFCKMMNRNFNWSISSENVALTNGSQNSFFYLFNLLAGKFKNGNKKILLPMVPEYIGYNDLGLQDNLFISQRAKIEITGEHSFKYHIDFENLPEDKEISLMCISRPTNPSANVIDDSELNKLIELAAENRRYLIVDNAYGQPFPGIIFKKTDLPLVENIIYTFSLSKFGIPGARTGIIVADSQIIKALSSMNAIINLSPGSFGPGLLLRVFRNEEILALSKNILLPFYKRKSDLAVKILSDKMKQYAKGVRYYLHNSEGAFFLWLWLPDLKIGTDELYLHLKKQKVLVVPGHYYFTGLREKWSHREKCLRISFTQDDRIFEAGFEIMAKTINKYS